MIKIDAEGFDYQILKGAMKTLGMGKIDIIQFEYNWRWIQANRSLWSVFELIQNTNYTLAKLTPNAVIEFQDWHFELDRYIEGNYILIKKGVTVGIPMKKAYFDTHNTIKICD
jgi:hypothetical protein